ncbi:MAG TPA: protein kinase, partial [Urbifossiella sp.]|nr:protein kinase [Urbifossiella sp.]
LRAAAPGDGTAVPDRPMTGLARHLTQPADPRPADPNHTRPTDRRPAGPVAAANAIPPELAENPNYEVVRELGRGGMGVVYLARNRLMDRPEVLKVMNRDLVTRPGAAERFLRELRSAARLAHPNVVRAYSAAQFGDTLMFAMEYVEGDDLAGLVAARGPLPVVNACYYTQQAAAGLQHAYEADMVHRDIKPANLILARSGRKHTAKILDFGLAKVRGEDAGDANLTGAGAMMGTPTYMAPEQWRDAALADIRADIYSLGCTLYFLLTGRPPFEGTWQSLLFKHQQEEPEPLTKVRPDVPVALADVARRMMAKDPAARYQVPADVVKALAPFVKPPTEPAAAPSAEGARPPAEGVPPPVEGVLQPAWKTMGDVSLIPVVVPDPPPKPQPQRVRRSRPKQQQSLPLWIWPAGACGIVIFSLLVAWAAGAFKRRTINDGPAVDNPRSINADTAGFMPPFNGKGLDHPQPINAEAAGFIPLFNGKDLTGWGKVGPDNLATSTWTVENGILIGRSKKTRPANVTG